MAAQMDTNKVPLLLQDCNKTKTEIENEIKDLKPEELTSKVSNFISLNLLCLQKSKINAG